MHDPIIVVLLGIVLAICIGGLIAYVIMDFREAQLQHQLLKIRSRRELEQRANPAHSSRQTPCSSAAPKGHVG